VSEKDVRKSEVVCFSTWESEESQLSATAAAAAAAAEIEIQ